MAQPPTDAEQAAHVCAAWATIINTQTGATRRLSVNDITSDQLDALYERLAELEKRLGTEEEISGRLLDQRQEMAAERYAWQERGDRAEISARANQTAAIEALERAEQAEAAVARVQNMLDSGDDMLGLDDIRTALNAEGELAMRPDRL